MEIENLDDLCNAVTEIKRDKENRRDYGVAKWSHRNDYPVFYTLAKAYNVDNVFECGTNGGMSACAWALALREMKKLGNVYTWDVQELRQVHHGMEISHKIVRHVESFHPTAGDVIRRVRRVHSGPALFFVDGDHSEKGCRADWVTILPHVRPGDAVVFHDYAGATGVKKIADELTESFNKYGYEITTNTGIYILEW